MLVLSRKSEEAVVVGEAGSLDPVVKVTVLEIRGGVVRLGFEAAAHVPIHRWEIWERIRAAVPNQPPFGEGPALPAGS